MLRLIKREEIKNYLEKYSDYPKQNSDEWIKERKKTIGGSEIAVIQGTSPFCTLRGLIERKIGVDNFGGSFATWWGKMFEDVVQDWCEYKFSTKIYGNNSFLRDFNDYEGFSYSPDGIGEAVLNEKTIYNDKVIGNISRVRIILFEFKSPFSKKIKEGMPQSYYVSQVKMGLNLIDIVEVGILVEAVFRRCSWGDLDFSPKYDNILHSKNEYKNVYTYGVIYVYTYKGTVIDRSDDPLKKLKQLYSEEYYDFNDVIDYGECSKELLGEVLKLSTENILFTIRSPLIVPNIEEHITILSTYEYLTTEDAMKASIVVLGYIPWKLMDVVYHIIEKEYDYLDKYKNDVSNILDIVDKCRNNPSNINRILNEHFCNKIEDNYVEV